MRTLSSRSRPRRQCGRVARAACVAVIALCATTAFARAASSTHRHAAVITWHAVVLASGAASDRRASGQFTGPPLGAGAVSYSVHLGAGTHTRAFRYRIDLFAVGGVLRVVIAGTASSHSGRTALSGSGHVTGGTGRYRHARGRLTLVGEGYVDSSGALANRSELRGSLTY